MASLLFGSEEAQEILDIDRTRIAIETESAKRVTCPRCNGWGEEAGFWAEEDEPMDCFLCDGLGKVWKEEAERVELVELAKAEQEKLRRWSLALDIMKMSSKQGSDLEQQIVEYWYHRICSRCNLDSVYIYPEGPGPLPLWPEPCVRCGWVPGSATAPDVEPIDT